MQDNFKRDFRYYLNYLHDNIASYKDINVDSLYKTYADYVCDCDSVAQFSELLKEFIKSRFDSIVYGYNSICTEMYNDTKADYEDLGFKDACELLETIKQPKKPAYEYSIINNVILLKVNFKKLPNVGEVINLKTFIQEHKDLDLYIDFRGISEEHNACVFNLLAVIYNTDFKLNHEDIKIYFKNNFRKPIKKYKEVSDNIKNEIELKYPTLENQLDKRCGNILEEAKFDTSKNLWCCIQHINFKCVIDGNFNANYTGNIKILIDERTSNSAQYIIDVLQGNERIKILANDLDTTSGGFGLFGRNTDENYPSYQLFILPHSKIVIACDFFYCDNIYRTKADDCIPEWLK